MTAVFVQGAQVRPIFDVIDNISDLIARREQIGHDDKVALAGAEPTNERDAEIASATKSQFGDLV